MYQDIAIISILWGVYFFMHSYLAATSTKNHFSSNFPNQKKHYRLFYTIFSTLGLFPIMYLLATIPSDLLLERSTLLKYFGLMLASFGVFLLKAAFKNYDTKEFMGVGMQGVEPKFVQKGLLNYMRHPIYTGTILLVTGFWLFIPNILNLVTVICVFIYLAIGIRLEEKKLVEEFGGVYTAFKKEVPMLVPRLSKLFQPKT